MAAAELTHFRDKHTPGEGVDPELAHALKAAAPQGELSCKEGFRLARELGRSPQQIGQAADLMEMRLTRCQLGLFGYHPQRKVVEAASEVSQELREAIAEHLVEGRLPCSEAWNIAGALGLSKMAVASACEALGVKIGPCQLGAF